MPSLEKLIYQVGQQQQNRREWNEGDDAFTVTQRLKDEVEELVKALDNFDVNENPDFEVASEIGDCLYLLASLCHHVGLDASRCLEMKVYRNAVKYPDTFMSNGWNRETAVQQAKSLYSLAGGDKVFYKWMADDMIIEEPDEPFFVYEAPPDPPLPNKTTYYDGQVVIYQREEG